MNREETGSNPVQFKKLLAQCRASPSSFLVGYIHGSPTVRDKCFFADEQDSNIYLFNRLTGRVKILVLIFLSFVYYNLTTVFFQVIGFRYLITNLCVYETQTLL